MPGGLALIRTAEDLRTFLGTLKEAPFIALDTETTGLDPHRDRLLLVQVGTHDRQGLIDAQKVGKELVVMIGALDKPIVMHHAKFDLKMLATLGERKTLARLLVSDTMLSEQLLHNGRKAGIVAQGFGLAALADRYAGMGLDKSVREGFTQVVSADELTEVELRYAARDVEATYKIFASQMPLLRAEGLLKAAAIEGAASWGFAEMELAGMPIDAAAWKLLVEEADRERAEAKRHLDRLFRDVLSFDLFGAGDLNYDSDQEVEAALKKLGVKVEGTRREVLEATGHPAALAVVAYREHQKIVSTYGRRFLEHIHPTTRRIHTSFKALGAITGRASSSEPNLQNIPATSRFRACFRAPPGRLLITADYAGAELRILAEVSGDPVFVRTFEEGGDLHSIVASRIFQKPVSKNEHADLRARAKAINFGLAYGMGAQGLASQIGSPLDEAEWLLDRYFKAFPSIRGYLERSAHEALRIGFAATLSGRKHWFQDLAQSGADEGTKLRVAKNMPIQGTNADMTKLAMARIARALAEGEVDAALVNMVHDEIVVEAAATAAERAREIVETEMVSAGHEFIRRVPVVVDTHVGEAWQK